MSCQAHFAMDIDVAMYWIMVLDLKDCSVVDWSPVPQQVYNSTLYHSSLS